MGNSYLRRLRFVEKYGQAIRGQDTTHLPRQTREHRISLYHRSDRRLRGTHHFMNGSAVNLIQPVPRKRLKLDFAFGIRVRLRVSNKLISDLRCQQRPVLCNTRAAIANVLSEIKTRIAAVALAGTAQCNPGEYFAFCIPR
jgi:hypothetical protein